MGEGAQDEGGEKELVGQETVFHTWKSDALGFSSQIPMETYYVYRLSALGERVPSKRHTQKFSPH